MPKFFRLLAALSVMMLFISCASQPTTTTTPKPTAQASNLSFTDATGPGAPAASDHEPGAMPYSLEKILAVNPDVLFIASLSTTQPLSKQLTSNPVWSHLKAVKDGQVYEVNPDFYIFGRGTRSLGLALDDAMHKLYPDVFTTPLT